jgi:hypothetical protein
LRLTRRIDVVALGALVLAPLAGCIIQTNDSRGYYDTQIEFQETVNLGATCSSPLTSWTVVNRNTGESGTASCEQPVRFVDLIPGRAYEFDITGRSGNRVCFQGSCRVFAEGGRLVQADCSRAIDRLCGF